MQPILTNHPRVVWDSKPEPIFAQLPTEKVELFSLCSYMVEGQILEPELLKMHPEIGFTNTGVLAMVLDEEVNGKPYCLHRDGRDNIFLLSAEEGSKKFTLRASMVMKSVWLLSFKFLGPSFPVSTGATYFWQK